jgi:hypothetical protein
MSWMRFWMTMAAWYQWASESWTARMRQWRAALFYHLLYKYDPRSMLLLQSGQWVDIGRGFHMTQVAWVYDSAHHMLYRPGENIVGRGIRWPWLGALEAGGDERDLTDFFTELRVSSAPTPAVPAVLGLFAHQKGWLPRGRIVVTRRDGEEMLLDATTGAVVDVAAPSSGGGATVAHVNHIQ